jgi:nitronate monooxygenase
MWPETRVTKLLGIRFPIIQGPFGGGLSSVALASTVSEAGGLGSFGAHMLDADGIQKLAAELRAKTQKPFALNLWVSSHDAAAETFGPDQFAAAVERFRPIYAELGIEPPAAPPPRYGMRFENQIQSLLDARPAAFSFVFGIPGADVLTECKRRGIVTLGAVTTPDEAIAMERAGVDVIVASGLEAGGHRPSFLRPAEESLMGTFSLVQTTAAVVKAPIVAAGGIATGRGIAGAFALGAEAAQVGTAFLATEESNTNRLHREALFSARAKDTVLTRNFSGRLARGIRNPFAERTEAPLPYPVQNWFSGTWRKAASEQGRSDLISMWSGQSAALLKHHHARELFEALVRETEASLAGALPRQ